MTFKTVLITLLIASALTLIARLLNLPDHLHYYAACFGAALLASILTLSISRKLQSGPTQRNAPTKAQPARTSQKAPSPGKASANNASPNNASPNKSAANKNSAAMASGGKKEFGSVKWFSASKGFGFITRDSGDDIFVHFRSINGEGHKLLREGQRVQFAVTTGSKGLQAEDVSALASN